MTFLLKKISPFFSTNFEIIGVKVCYRQTEILTHYEILTPYTGYLTFFLFKFAASLLALLGGG
jgi:hypothetical protein